MWVCRVRLAGGSPIFASQKLVPSSPIFLRCCEGPQNTPSMNPYEIIDHTSDCGIKVYGKSLEELFTNAALGMFEIIGGKYDPSKSKDLNHKTSIEIQKKTSSLEELLVGFLSELLYKSFKEKVIFKKEIKAVTFHDLKIELDKELYHCTIIFDI